MQMDLLWTIYSLSAGESPVVQPFQLNAQQLQGFIFRGTPGTQGTHKAPNAKDPLEKGLLSD